MLPAIAPRGLRPLVVAALFLVTSVAYATIGAALQMQTGNPSSATSDPNNHTHYLIQRDQYAMDYNDTTRVPNWVAWDLTSSDVGSSGRSTFIVDTTLPGGFYQVLTTDYSGSGFDRGHLCPSGDRTVTVADNQQVFYMSNMMPQAPDNNQGVWANFESYCRTLASAGNELLIIAGPSGYGGSTIASGVAIPGFTWKIVVVAPLGAGTAFERITASTRVIAIKIPNTSGVRTTPWENFITTVAQIQSDTGYTFFNALPTAIGNALRNAPPDGQVATGLPTITTNPTAQSAPLGGSATFTVVADANGNPPLSYQWLKDDAEIVGATNASLSLSGIAATGAGSYVVVVTNPIGSVTSASAALVVTGLPPSIETPPAPKVAVAGTTVTFSVTAGGTPTLFYQWRKGLVNLANGGNVSGATNATLTLNNVQSGEAGSYDVVVTNTVSSTTSSAALLTVTPAAPTITSQPVAHNVATGGTTTFVVAASGTNDATNPLTYQWRKASVNLANGGVVSGADSATLTLAGVTALDAGNYDVVVSNGIAPAATSNSVALTVTAASTLSQISYTGGTYSQNFNALGTSNSTIGGTQPFDLNTVSVSLAGWSVAASPGPLPPTTVFADAGSNTTGGIHSYGAASVAERALGTVASGSATPRFGATMVNNTGATISQFTVSYVGEQWRTAGNTSIQTIAFSYAVGGSDINTGTFVNKTELDFTSPIATSAAAALDGNLAANRTPKPATTISGITWLPGQTLVLRWTDFNDVGNDHGLAVDDFSFTTPISSAATAPVVTSNSPANAATNVPVNSSISVTFNQNVNVAGSWFSITSAANGAVAATVTSVSTAGGQTYTFTPPVSFANSDTITVNIVASQVTEAATGTLHPAANTTFSFTTAAPASGPTAPVVTTQPVSQSVMSGTNVSFTVAASGTTPLAYQWRLGGVAIAGNASATAATLSLPAVTTANIGSYDCVVTNVAGSDVSQVATLAVTVAPPTIIASPATQTVAAGTNASFTVVPGGTGPFTYQWRRGGLPLSDGGTVSGALTATVTIAGVTAADEASFDVVVTNVGGSTPSAAAKLFVLDRIPYAGGTYAQDFNGLPTSTTVQTMTGAGPFPLSQVGGTNLLGWSFAKVGSGNALFNGGNGSANQGAMYSFGAAVAADRALGAVLSGTTESTWGLVLVNNTGTTLNYFRVTYRGEQWRRGGGSTAADKISLEYQLGGTTVLAGSFTAAPAGDFSSVVATNAAATLDGNTNFTPVTAVVGGVTWAPGQTLVIRWRDFNVTSSDDGLAVDDFSFTAGTATAPVIVSTTPLNGAAGVPVASPVTVTFDQPVNVSGSWFTIAGAASGAVTATASGGPTTFTFTPAANFALGDTITTTIVGAQVKEQVSGAIPLAANFVFSFATIVAPPTITTPPASQTVTVGDNVSFSVVAGGAGPFAYQWRKGGNPIGGATNAGYSLTSVTTADVGSFDVVVTNAGGSTPSAPALLAVNKGTASVVLSNLSQTYNTFPHPVTVATVPAVGLVVTYNGSLTPPTGAGSYVVVATVDDPNYVGIASGTLVVAKATAAVTLSNLRQPYDGTPKTVAATTNPAGLTVVLTYDGSATPPTSPGSHAVFAAINEANYAGSASGSLLIPITVIVRHAPSLNGDVDGSVQMLLGENTSLSGNAGISGDLLVPGTPSVRLNGKPTLGGIRDGTGGVAPADYSVTLGGNALVRFIGRRTDPIAIPAVAAPPAPAGTRIVSLNSAGQSAGDFTTLRNLTLSGNAGQVAVPAGTYGALSAGGNSGFTLGVPGATSPAVYDFQGLALSGNGRVLIVGPVVINLATGMAIEGAVGAPAHPEWLALNLFSGGLTMNGIASFNGFVLAPAGTVTLNGSSTLNGGVICDRLTINGSSLLKEVP